MFKNTTVNVLWVQSLQKITLSSSVYEINGILYFPQNSKKDLRIEFPLILLDYPQRSKYTHIPNMTEVHVVVLKR